ncbi:MAG: translation elongation factor Ts [Vampirovibrionales bacterium]|nr:translation elongation factor Ts [Vampirovibrionales bacterium]
MTITASQVKELREMTGAGMMEAKKALEEATGDMDKAKEILRQRGMATAEKKAGRAAADGLVEALVSDDKQSGVLVEVNCETDFVAKGEAFQSAAKQVSQNVAEKKPASVETLREQLQGFITEQIATIKENITIRRFVRYERTAPGLVQAYIHTGGKIGVLLELSAKNAASAQKPEVQQLAKDIAMQIASFAPEFVSRNDIGQAVIDEETRIEMGKEDIQKKPADIRAKIVEGRVNKLLGERVLIEQAFIKDPGKTVSELIAEISKAIGDELAVVQFTRYVLGEGIEKKESNFAEEVAAAAKV